ncbi:MAG: winged helix-turn-helix transcriptional regulator [Clostridia bacterium]|nr:winged helix-turn-helix transcriptional regulator [Clostridia bacterium]
MQQLKGDDNIKPFIEPRDFPQKVIGIEIRSLGNMVMRLMEKKGHKKAIDDATGTNGWILRYLADEERAGKDVFQRDIETRFCITRSTVSKVLSLMEQKKLIERKNVEYDARLRKIILTEKSRELLKLMCEDGHMAESILRGALTDEELKEFFRLTNKLKESIRDVLEEQ